MRNRKMMITILGTLHDVLWLSPLELPRGPQMISFNLFQMDKKNHLGCYLSISEKLN